MKPRDAFGVILRALAVCLCLAGVLDLVHLTTELLGLPVYNRRSVGEDLTSVAEWIIVGVAFFAATPLITRLLYGRDN